MTDKPTLTQAERAREMLAAEYEADGAIYKARELRGGEPGSSPDNLRALRAIERALSPALPEEVGEIVEDALRSAHTQGYFDGVEDQREGRAHPDCRREGFQNWLSNEGATLLTALSTRRAEGIEAALREALKPFAQALDDWGDEPEQSDQRNLWDHPAAIGISLGDLRRANAVYKEIR